MTDKRLFLVCVLLLLSASLGFAQTNSIQSLLGVAFGQVCTLRGEFVDKPRTYYAQNVSQAEYYLKIIEINGQALSEPLVVEPVCEGFKPEPGKMIRLKAYEKVESQNEPESWSDSNIAGQFSYWIIHKIVVRQL